MEKKKAIIIDCFNHYDYRIKYVDNYLKSKGYLTAIYMADYDHMKREYNKNTEVQKGINYIHVQSYKKNISPQRIFSHLTFERKVLERVKRINPDLVFCEIPPNYIAHELVKLKRKIGFTLIFDIIDLWPESFPKGDLHIPPFEIWRRWRNSSLKEADKVLLECNYYEQTLKKYVTENNIQLLPLIKEPLADNIIDEWKQKHTKRKTCENINLCYLGSINSLIDIAQIEIIIKNIQSIAPVTLKIIGDGELRKEFINRVGDLGVKTEFFGRIFDDDEKINIFSDCQFGLNIYKPSLNIGMTLKSLDYFKMGIPIINNIAGDTWELVKKRGVGVNIDSLYEIRDFLDNNFEKHMQVWTVFDESFSSKNVEKIIRFLN